MVLVMSFYRGHDVQGSWQLLQATCVGPGRRQKVCFSSTLIQVDTSSASIINPSETGNSLESTSRFLRIFFLIHSTLWPFPS